MSDQTTTIKYFLLDFSDTAQGNPELVKGLKEIAKAYGDIKIFTFSDHDKSYLIQGFSQMGCYDDIDGFAHCRNKFDADAYQSIRAFDKNGQQVTIKPENALVIDDMPYSIDAITEAGGQGVEFYDNEECFSDVKSKLRL